ncbi:MAG: response regulator [Bacteroidota bacterium]|jgi:CheY-like chemotaxis protein
MEHVNFLMLIDDNEITNFYHEDILRDLEIINRFQIFSTSASALDYLKKVFAGEAERPDLILLDLKMPEMDGFDLLNELEEYNHDETEKLKIVILTSSTLKRDREMADRFPFLSGFIEKPATDEKLRNLIASL